MPSENVVTIAAEAVNGHEPVPVPTETKTKRRRQPAASPKLPRNATLKLSEIEVSKELQPRVTLNQDAIADYADVVFTGGKLPPVTVFEWEKGKYLLADGFHRLAAYRKLGILDTEAYVFKGNREDAIRYAIGANQAHGLRRSNADKRRAVEMAFTLMKAKEENWTDADISELAGVSAMFVGNVRKEAFAETYAEPRQSKAGKTLVKRQPAKVAKTKEAAPETAPDPEPVPEPGANGKYPLGVALDRLNNRLSATDIALDELLKVFPTSEALAEAIATNPNVVKLYQRMRALAEHIHQTMSGIELPYEVRPKSE